MVRKAPVTAQSPDRFGVIETLIMFVYGSRAPAGNSRVRSPPVPTFMRKGVPAPAYTGAPSASRAAQAERRTGTSTRREWDLMGADSTRRVGDRSFIGPPSSLRGIDER